MLAEDELNDRGTVAFALPFSGRKIASVDGSGQN